MCRRVGWRADVEGARANGGPQGAKGLCEVRGVGSVRRTYERVPRSQLPRSQGDRWSEPR